MTTLEELKSLTNCELVGDPAHKITGVDDLETASQDAAAFLENPRYERQLKTSQAGVIFVSPAIKREAGRNYLVSDNPSLSFQKALEHFLTSPATGFSDIHPSAVIHDSVTLGKNVTISPNAVIDQGVTIGDNTLIGPNATIGAQTTIGTNCHIHANASIREACTIGNRVIVQPGAVIGSCGFGYSIDETGFNHKLKQLGTVIIEDDVEIGANSTIDRARFKHTRIARGTKIDNLVQIAHQVELGENNLIASQTGIAGSTKTGRHVVMGGQVGVAGHITITDETIFAAQAAVSKSIDKSGVYSGKPAAPIREFNLQYVQLRSIGRVIKRLKALEAKVGKE